MFFSFLYYSLRLIFGAWGSHSTTLRQDSCHLGRMAAGKTKTQCIYIYNRNVPLIRKFILYILSCGVTEYLKRFLSRRQTQKLLGLDILHPLESILKVNVSCWGLRKQFLRLRPLSFYQFVNLLLVKWRTPAWPSNHFNVGCSTYIQQLL